MSIKIRQNGLLNRWYQEWVRRGGQAPPTKNLCHYVWVWILWGPLQLLFNRAAKMSRFCPLIEIETDSERILRAVNKL